jgi:hypothetical protein
LASPAPWGDTADKSVRAPFFDRLKAGRQNLLVIVTYLVVPFFDRLKAGLQNLRRGYCEAAKRTKNDEPRTTNQEQRTKNPFPAMPFDPTIPQENTPIDAAPMREQFNSLKALMDACATSVDLANAVQTTSSNSNAVGSLAMNVDPDYNQNQMQLIVNKLEELINALRR